MVAEQVVCPKCEHEKRAIRGMIHLDTVEIRDGYQYEGECPICGERVSLPIDIFDP